MGFLKIDGDTAKNKKTSSVDKNIRKSVKGLFFYSSFFLWAKSGSKQDFSCGELEKLSVAGFHFSSPQRHTFKARADATAKVRVLTHIDCVPRSVFFVLFCPDICKKQCFSKNRQKLPIFVPRGSVTLWCAFFLWLVDYFFVRFRRKLQKGKLIFFVLSCRSIFNFFASQGTSRSSNSVKNCHFWASRGAAYFDFKENSENFVSWK